jgi:hypothetical protein
MDEVAELTELEATVDALLLLLLLLAPLLNFASGFATAAFL